MKHILFFGDRPSPRMKINAKPFKGAACENRLREWIVYLTKDIRTTVWIENQVNCDIGLLQYWSRGCIVVALGNNASKALTKASVSHFKLPHPSGLNRQLNNKKYVAKRLKECYNYIREEIQE